MANNRYIHFEQQAFATETFTAFDAAALLHPIDQVSEDLSEDHGFVYPTTSAQRTNRARILGPRVGGGEIAVPLYTVGTTTLIHYAMGATATTEAAAGPPANNEHKSTIANTVPAFRMAIGKDLNEHQYVGCAMKSMKLDYTVGDPALATFDVLYRKELSPPATLATPTFPDYDVVERTFIGTEVVTEIDDTPVPGVIRTFSLELNNDLVEDNHGFGDRFLPALRVQNAEVTGSFTMLYDVLGRYQDGLDEAEKKLSFLFSTGTLGMTGYRAVEVLLEKVSLDVTKLPTDSNKEYIIDVNFTAEIDTAGDSEQLQVITHNDETAAAVTT